MNLSKGIWFACFIMSVSIFFKDTCVPSLPAIAGELHASSVFMAYPITLYVVGMAFSQLIWGTLSDVYGRKRALGWGLLICFAGLVLSLSANSVLVFVASRLITGFGAGACPVLSRAIITDLCKDKALIRAFSYLSMATVLPTSLAPLIGGFLQDFYGWRMSFYLLTLIAILTVYFANRYFDETNLHPQKKTIRKIAGRHLSMLYNREFQVYSMLSGAAYAATIVFYIISPFLFQHELHFSARANGSLYFFIALSYLLSTYLTGRLAQTIDEARLMHLGIAISLASSLLMIAAYYWYGMTVWAIMLPMMLNVFGAGIMTPLSNKGGVSMYPDEAGAAAALIGSARMVLAFLIGLVVVYVGTITPGTLGAILLGLSLIAYAAFGLRDREPAALKILQ